tara:strand:+ start:2092 stop:2325 length:234 start_codon:yes stop_codon:yes gene_type:complete
MNTLRLFLAALTTLAVQYGAYLENKRENEIDKIEDEIDALAANGSPASKLRMERLAKRIKRKSEQLKSLHSGNSNID